MNAGRAVVIGAGVAGLAAAIDLARQGNSVTIVDGAGAAGGKMRQLMVGSQAVDAGPTVLTMRWVFEELLHDAGMEIQDFVTFRNANLLARHAWNDGSRLDLFADVDASVAAIAELSGAVDANAYRKFTSQTAKIYETVRGPFLRSQRPSMFGLVAGAARIGLTSIAQIDGATTLWKRLCATFRDPRLRQLFGRYATYTGSSPFEAPATLALISHVERSGVSHVEGGMVALARGLEAAAKRLGVTTCYGEPATRIVSAQGRTAFVETTKQSLAASIVVFAGDVAALASGKLGECARRACESYRFPIEKRSLSALTYALVAKTEGFPLAHHNVFFSEDYENEFRDLFVRRTFPTKPTVYVCAQDRDDLHTPAGLERLLMIVNAPATGDAPDEPTEREALRCETSMNQVLANSGLKLQIEASQRTTPRQFEQLFPATGGALYGLASHGPMSAFKRPAARTKLPGLYLASGSAHPGAGVPMAALSGRLCARAVAEDSSSIQSFPTVATAGSISTA
jgi:1-hydroxycarotenoid 3,4-desaturase